MDPLSIASGIAGLVTLADVVIERTYRTIMACKNAGKNAEKLLKEVTSLLGLLKSLEILELQVSEKELQIRISPDQRYHCQKMLEKLRDKLGEANPKDTSSRFRKLERTFKWPFTSEETEETLKEIERYKTAFNLTVSMEALEAMFETTADRNNLNQDVKDIQAHLRRIEMTEEHQKILSFFKTFDSEADYAISVKLRQPGTGLWLTNSPELQHWRSRRNGGLWLYGIPGAGKTVLAGLVIEEAIQIATPLVGLAYHYCDYKRLQSGELQTLLASIVGQLAFQSEACYKKLRFLYHPPSEQLPLRILPDTSVLIRLFHQMATHFDEVMLVVDAVDESPNAQALAQNLRDILKSDESVKIIVFSRNEQEIRYHLEQDFTSLEIAARNSDLQLFVASEIETRITSRRLRIRSSRLKDEILERLVQGAQGMFRWVVCQIDHLGDLSTDADRRKALECLPPDLNTTYARILGRISKQNENTRRLVQRVLAWLITDSNQYGVERLTVEQLCEAISIDENQTSMDLESIPDPEDILLRCSSLTRLSSDGKYIELAHFTVEEYLRNSIQCTEVELLSFKYSKENSGAYLLTTCLTYLLFDLGVEPVRAVSDLKQKENDFQHKAANLCLGIARGTHLRSKQMVLLKNMFSTDRQSSLLSWMQMVLYTYSLHGYIYSVQVCPFAQLLCSSTPLSLACILGLGQMVECLLEGGVDINERAHLGWPIHCAILGDLTLKDYAQRRTRTDKPRLGQGRIAQCLLAAGGERGCVHYDKDAMDRGIQPRFHERGTFVLASENLCWRTLLEFKVAPDQYMCEAILERPRSTELEQEAKDILQVLAPNDKMDGISDPLQELHRLTLGMADKAQDLAPASEVLSGQGFGRSKEPEMIPIDSDFSSLEFSLSYSDTKAVRRFWEKHDINELLRCGCTLLTLALGAKKLVTSIHLLSRGAALNVTGCSTHANGLKAYCLPISHPDLIPALQLMLQRSDFPKAVLHPTHLEPEYEPLLHMATEYNDRNAVELLLRAGASVNSADARLKTPLHYAAEYDRYALIPLLMEAGGKTTAFDGALNTPIHIAAREGNVKALSELLKSNDLDISLQNVVSNTPVQEAAQFHRTEAVMMLVSAGADIRFRSAETASAWSHLTKDQSSTSRFVYADTTVSDPFALFEHNNIGSLRYLLRGYSRSRLFRDINAAMRGVYSDSCRLRVRPLHNTVRRSLLEVTQVLIDYGALINLECGPEGTPLMAACTYGRFEAVKMLVRLGAIESYHKHNFVYSAVRQARHFENITRWLLVTRYTDQGKVTGPDANVEPENVWPRQKTPKPLNLDLILWEDWKAYLAKNEPTSCTVFVCRVEGRQSSIEISYVSKLPQKVEAWSQYTTHEGLHSICH